MALQKDRREITNKLTSEPKGFTYKFNLKVKQLH